MRALLLAAGLLACSSGGTPVEPLDAGVDATDAVADVDPFGVNVTGLKRCGPGPYILHRHKLSAGWGTRAPLVGAKIKTDVCPDLDVTSDATGTFAFLTTRGVTYDLFYSHDGPGNTVDGVFNAVVPVDFTGYTFAKEDFPLKDGVIQVVRWVNPGRGKPCGWTADLKVWVRDHPEAHVHYFGNDGTDHDAPSPDEEYNIMIDSVPFGTDLVIEGSKPGCKVFPHYHPALTGVTRAYKGYRSGVPIEIGESLDVKTDGGTD